tara:strand:+ start:683 stop:1087 length:405 start_codon:yes stop_codon:yes gene_type:complete
MSGIIGVSPDMRSGVIGAVPSDVATSSEFDARLPILIASGSATIRDGGDAWTTLYTFTPSEGDMYLINGIHASNTYVTWVLSYRGSWFLGTSIHQSNPPYMQGQMSTNALQAKTTFGGTGNTYVFFWSITQIKT